MLQLALAGLLVGTQTSPSPKIVHASIFKNGYAFVTRELPVTKSGEVEIDDLPASTYGTLWFAATPGIDIKQVTRGESTKTSTIARAGSLEDLLQNNIGRQVTLNLKDLPSAAGTLKSVQGDLIVLSDGQVDHVVFRSQVLGLTATAPLSVTSQTEVHAKTLHVRVEAKGPGRLEYVSLEQGLSWDPAYLVEMGDGKLTLTSRATITNDLGDIGGIEVMLSALAPDVSSIGSIESLFGEVAYGRATGPSGPATLVGGQGLVGESIDFISYDPTDNSLVVRGNEPAPSAVWANATGAQGVKREDQFFYRQADVRLKRGERAQFVLSKKVLPYTDIYTMNVTGANGGTGSVDTPNQQAYHHIAFINQSSEPLTEAPAAFIADGQLVGQSMIRYTPIGGRLEYTLGAAPEVRGFAAENEQSRARAAKFIGKQSYDLMDMKGRIQIKNLGTKPIKIRVSKEVTGDLIDSTNKPAIVKYTQGDGMNSINQMLWDLEIPVGRTVTVTYEYKTYVKGS